jgi:hypothetical protein
MKYGMSIALTLEADSEEDASKKIEEVLSKGGISSNDFDIEDGPEVVEEGVEPDEDE